MPKPQPPIHKPGRGWPRPRRGLAPSRRGGARQRESQSAGDGLPPREPARATAPIAANRAGALGGLALEARSPAGSAARLPVSLCVVGLGNIGSQLIPFLAHLPGLRQVLLVDRDRYEVTNLDSQAIVPKDVGRPKALVQKLRLRRLNPNLQVEVFVGDLGALPAGRLGGSLVAGCLDSIGSRARLGELAWRAGAPFLDAGVNPEAGLVRVTCFLPGPGRACFACGLDERDYAAMGAVQPCSGSVASAPSGAGLALGGLAAAWLALECERWLRSELKPGDAGRETLLEVRSGRLLISQRRRNPACRFDHRAWRLTPFRGVRPSTTLVEALRLAGRSLRAPAAVGLRLPGLRLAKALHCAACGAMFERFHILDRSAAARCPRCRRGLLMAVGFKLVDRLDRHLPRPLLRRTLSELGVQAGDVFAAEVGHRVRHWVVPGDWQQR